MEMRVIENMEELLSHAEAWNEILRENGNTNPYVTPDWIMGWWRFYGGGWRPHVLALEHDSRLIGLFPLMTRKKGFIRDVKFIGYRQSGRMSFIARRGFEREFCERVAGYLLAEDGEIRYTLHGLRQDDACYRVLREALAKRSCAVRTEPCSIIDLKKTSWDEFIKARKGNSNIRQTLSREKSLGGLAGLRFEKAGPEDMETVFSLHDKRWLKRNDGNGFSRGISKEFFTWLVRERRSGSWEVQVYLLMAGSRPIGFAYGILCNGRFTFYRIAHDDSFGYFKPGMIVTRMILEHCFRSGYSEFDFSTGDEPFKRYWAGDVEWTDRIMFGTGILAGSLGVGICALRLAILGKLRKNRVLARLKHVTLGKAKYALTGKAAAACLNRIGCVIRHRGLCGIPIYLLNRWLPDRGRLEYVTNTGDWAVTDGTVSLRVPALDECREVARITDMAESVVVERYARGGRCQILETDGQARGWAWMTETEITQDGKPVWRPVRPGDRCLYDICLAGCPDADSIREALIVLASQPLSRVKNTLTVILCAWDRRLRREAEKLPLRAAGDPVPAGIPLRNPNPERRV